jgi:Methyltransferase small domain
MLRGVQGKAPDLETYLPERLVDEAFSWQTLARLLAGKLARRATGGRVQPRWPLSVVAYYGEIAVFDKPEQHLGGMGFGRDFPRVLNELGIGRRPRVFEFCAGPGYIGYSLLAAGWCESLVLSDINPDAAASARYTAEHNALAGRVDVYVSDALDQIPADECWDLVVANPPHFPRAKADVRHYDPEWDMHRRFYAKVGRHMNPRGLVLMVENADGSDPDLFDEMIRAGGGEPRVRHPGTDIHGNPNGLYYHLSAWPGLSGSPDWRSRSGSRRPTRIAGSRALESRLSP